MLTGFEKQTKPLTDYERDTLLPVIVRGLQTKIGYAKAITNAAITRAMRGAGYKLNEARVRKIINHIRNHHMVGCLVATNKGYFVATSSDEVDKYIESLHGRIRSIQEDIESIKQQQKYYFN